MSYDIELCDPVTGIVLQLDMPHHMRGGTYAIGGTTDAHLNVTWNYGKHFRATIGPEGIRTIYGMTGADSIPILQGAADKLGNDVDADYWSATEGNAKRAILSLVALAKMRPDGVWKVD